MKQREAFDIEGAIYIRKDSSQQLMNLNERPKDTPINLTQNSSKIVKIFSFLSIVESKVNSYMRMLYFGSIFEIALFLVSIFLFVSLPFGPENVYFLVVTGFHFIKALVGLSLLSSLPKTYQMCDHFTWEFSQCKEVESQDDIIKRIKSSCKVVLLNGVIKSKCWLISYFIFNFFAIPLDVIMFCLYYYLYQDINPVLIQGSVLLLVVTLFVIDFVYYFWIATIDYTFPSEQASIIKKVLHGQTKPLEEYFESL